MIMLDTNVISQAMSPNGNRLVRAWLNRQDDHELFLSAPVFAELSFGVERLSVSRKQTLYADALAKIQEAFRSRVLPFDLLAATRYAKLCVTREGRERSGKPFDLMIAAIALTHDMTLATRNVRDFEDMGLRLVNPFEA
ncbi:MAG: type II toxin-antitoxin system VapC family toxin [Bosea sp. (in: a-proteobacteria)]